MRTRGRRRVGKPAMGVNCNMPYEPNESFDQRIHETRTFLHDNGNPEAEDEDALELLMQDCGQDDNGHCQLAGTEYCDFECPFRN